MTKLVYDDDCGFCTSVAKFCSENTPVELVGFSELTDDEIEQLPQDYKECSHLIHDDGSVDSCHKCLPWVLNELGHPRTADIAQTQIGRTLLKYGYFTVAKNRPTFSTLTEFFTADEEETSPDTVTDIIESYSLDEEEQYEFVNHPGIMGGEFEDGDEVFGHLTIDEINRNVVRVRLFPSHEDAVEDISEYEHPYGLSILCSASITVDESGNARLCDVDIIEKKERN
jgi:hypothetical protein